MSELGIGTMPQVDVTAAGGIEAGGVGAALGAGSPLAAEGLGTGLNTAPEIGLKSIDATPPPTFSEAIPALPDLPAAQKVDSILDGTSAANATSLPKIDTLANMPPVGTPLPVEGSTTDTAGSQVIVGETTQTPVTTFETPTAAGHGTALSEESVSPAADKLSEAQPPDQQLEGDKAGAADTRPEAQASTGEPAAKAQAEAAKQTSEAQPATPAAPEAKSQKYAGLSQEEEGKFEAFKQNPPKNAEQLKEYQTLAGKHAEGKQIQTIEDKMHTGEPLSDAEQKQYLDHQERNANGADAKAPEQQPPENKEPTMEEKMEELNAEDDQLTQEMMDGKNYDQNMQKLQENYAKKQELRSQARAIELQQIARKKKEIGLTNYEKEVQEAQAHMQALLREVLTAPQQVAQLAQARRQLVQQYKDQNNSFKIDEDNATSKEAVQHFGKLRQVGAQIARVNVMLAEAKLGADVNIAEFNFWRNKHDRLVGAKGMLSYLGTKLITRVQQQINTQRVDAEARRIANKPV